MTTLEAKLKKIDDLRTNNTISDAEKETARAKVIADHVSGDTGAAILQHYKEEHRQKIYPYMIKKQQIDDENALIPAIPIEEQQRTFADLVKNAQLSAERVLFSSTTPSTVAKPTRRCSPTGSSPRLTPSSSSPITCTSPPSATMASLSCASTETRSWSCPSRCSHL
jgi:hypothetical protein